MIQMHNIVARCGSATCSSREPAAFLSGDSRTVDESFNRFIDGRLSLMASSTPALARAAIRI